ncbi:hypothetical protein WJX84_007068 [Apatococcus fuscideae]|uniref:Uncharacterized protein n=1 Tax=Apatococcus fuscideae TaxID=2026836 RepID=A0AAW1TI80_9CHLO
MASYLQPYAEHTARQAELDQMRRLIADQQDQANRQAAEQVATRPGWGPAGQHSSNTPSHMGTLSPGHLATPTRIGQDLHPFLTGAAPQIPAGPDGPVVSIAASRYFSAQVTADGRVWTFGGGFNGELGGAGSSWLSAARPVDGPIAEALQREGGAAHVAAGGTFCVCLTASGKVVVWGQLPGDRQHGQPRAAVQILSPLPPITHIACGSSHALLSDGERVWAIGRWLSADGAKPMGGSGLNPQQVLDLRGEGVLQLAAGAHSSAAVSGDGRLMLWGKLLAHEHATSLAHSYGSNECEAAVKKWGFSEGMGADEPVHVPGLHNVKGVALGATHATVLLG